LGFRDQKGFAETPRPGQEIGFFYFDKFIKEFGLVGISKVSLNNFRKISYSNW
jgi:hypothetical protein